MNKIIPAILQRHFEQIETLASEIKIFSDKVQLDICDGVYVKSKTWPFYEYSKDEFIAIGSDNFADVYMPEWETVDYSVDMMTEKPFDYIDTLISFGFVEIIFHYNTICDLDLKVIEIAFEKCKNADMKIAIAIDINTDIENFFEFLKIYNEKLEYLQIMGIRNIGKQGEVFDIEVLEIIKKVKAYTHLPICIDGGMNDEAIYECKIAGANMFVVGSYLIDSENPYRDFKYLENL